MENYYHKAYVLSGSHCCSIYSVMIADYFFYTKIIGDNLKENPGMKGLLNLAKKDSSMHKTY